MACADCGGGGGWWVVGGSVYNSDCRTDGFLTKSGQVFLTINQAYQAYGLEFGKSFPNYHLLQLSPQHWHKYHKSSPLNQKFMGPKLNKKFHVASGGRCSCCMIRSSAAQLPLPFTKSTALNHVWIWWIPSDSSPELELWIVWWHHSIY